MKTSGSVLTVDAGNFRAEVLESSEPVLLKFTTEWCGPCKAIAPIVESVARDYAGRLKVAELDAERAPEIAAQFGVRGFPTMLLLKDGREVGRQLGAVPRARLVALFEEHV